ncbi:hypothetical protein ACIRRA_34040 [Nocardia sp. NPDC101769]|uniref:hypothetical protein n=1 Tax=Nocardia sp. NPDC101769 TaxID=3364333 RepID=UPI003804AFFF
MLGVTEPLAKALSATDFTGYRLAPATGVPTDYPNDHGVDPSKLVFPVIYALQIIGQPGVDDFAETYRLVSAERATDLLCTRDPALADQRGEVDVDGRMIRGSM